MSPCLDLSLGNTSRISINLTVVHPTMGAYVTKKFILSTCFLPYTQKLALNFLTTPSENSFYLNAQVELMSSISSVQSHAILPIPPELLIPHLLPSNIYLQIPLQCFPPMMDPVNNRMMGRAIIATSICQKVTKHANRLSKNLLLKNHQRWP